MLTGNYPDKTRERNTWIEEQRTERHAPNLYRPYDFYVEDERSKSGEVEPAAAVFLSNRECPWRCLMCDLWKNTVKGPTPEGAIPAQLDYALQRMPDAPVIKLYNSGSFFDHKAIPPCDYPAIARRLRNFEHVIVESHPALVGDGCLRFRDMINGTLEIAMGLETVHPEVLKALNKGISLEQFTKAARFIKNHDMDLRVFILIKPPFMDEHEGIEWAQKSLDFAFDLDTDVAAVIPVRGGNGAMEQLQQDGLFEPPKLSSVEKVLDYGLGKGYHRVFADLWDLEQFSECDYCFEKRRTRLNQMNLTQEIIEPITCEYCSKDKA